MIKQFKSENASDIKFQLLSVASLETKINDGIDLEKLYNNAERKFDTLIGLLSNEYNDDSIINSDGYSLHGLKELSFGIFQRLISHADSNPFMRLCVSENAPLDEIKRRRNRLLHVFHPDRKGNEVSNGPMAVKINEAYEQIVNSISTSEPASTSFKNNISTSFTGRYTNSKKSYEKTFYLVIAVTIFILAFIGLMKIIIAY